MCFDVEIFEWFVFDFVDCYVFILGLLCLIVDFVFVL